MKKKGFTLIELLAVIVILGIIAVIAVPMINGVIKESRLGAFKASTLSLFHAYTNYEAEHGFEVKDELSIFELDITNKSTFVSGEIYRKEDLIKVETVSNGVYCASGTSDNLKIVEGTCDLLDETPPLIISVTTEVTTNSIKLYTSYLEEESFIGKHEYRIAKENEDIESVTWVSGDSLTENLSTKTFSGLEQGVKYKIQIRLTNTALENNVSEIYELEVSALTLEKPVITLLTSKEYATQKEVKITYPEGEGFIYEYSLNGENWISVGENEKEVTVEENTTVRARVYDGTNVVYADALTISGIDKTKPVVTIVKNVVENKNILTSTIEPVSTVSGYTYTWYKDGEVISGETSSTLTTTTAGVYQLKVTTGAGVESVSNEITIQSYTITYNLNGGTGSIPSVMKVENVIFNITSQVPTRAGYQFVGWGLTSTDKTPTYTSGSSYTKNESITLYAIFKKGYTITFVENGATLSKKTESCEVFNNETGCTITTPTITRSGYSIIGYGESAGAKTSVVGNNATITVNGNKTYYAITSKVLTANFHKNTVSSISATSSSCTIYNTETSCTPTLPMITPQANFTNNGWGTSAGQTSNGVTSITLNTSNTGSTWYALNSRVLTWNFNKNTVSSISATSRTCTIWNASGSCTITTPTITPQANFMQQGFGTAAGSTSATIAQNASMSLSNSKTGGTYYALNSRVLTWNFHKNTVSSISATSRSCTIWNTSASCTITTPTITAQTNFTQQGFGTATGSTSATVAQNASMTLNNTTTGGTYYALNARTLTWNFNKNTVSSISATSRNCTIWATNGTCTITTPTITPQANFMQQGFGTAAGSTSAAIAQNASMSLSNSKTGGTYYALNSRRLTWNFNKGSVSSISKTTDGCTIWSTGATCTISAPTITPVSGYTGNGFGTASTATSAMVAASGTITLSNSSNGGTYYGLQKKTITITYNGNGATGGSTASQSCTMYNANTTCSVKLNSNGFTRTGYSFQGYGTGTTTVSHNAGTSYNFSNNATLYAIWKVTSIAGIVENDPGVITEGGGGRYTGANPNNYVSFNGELWRIIGVFDGKVKIIRNESIGDMAWSSANVSTWQKSTLYNYLNTTYYNGINTTYKNMIENATWRTGGWHMTDVTAAQMYEYEGSSPALGSSTTATGYIGMMSASDYGYASSGCYGGSQTLVNYYESACASTNWLFLNNNRDMWTMTTNSLRSGYGVSVRYRGGTSIELVSSTFPVRPSLYLKSNVYIKGGVGTSGDPYILGT